MYGEGRRWTAPRQAHEEAVYRLFAGALTWPNPRPTSAGEGTPSDSSPPAADEAGEALRGGDQRVRGRRRIDGPPRPFLLAHLPGCAARISDACSWAGAIGSVLLPPARRMPSPGGPSPRPRPSFTRPGPRRRTRAPPSSPMPHRSGPRRRAPAGLPTPRRRAVPPPTTRSVATPRSRRLPAPSP